MTASVACGRHVAGRQPGAAGRDDQARGPATPSRERRLDLAALVGRPTPGRPRSPSRGAAPRGPRPTSSVAVAGRDAVAHGQHERARARRHAPSRAVRHPSRLSASCGSGPATRSPGPARPWRLRGPPLRRLPVGRRHSPLLPPDLRDEADRPDLDAALDALDHVVDGERRHGGRGQGLHLDAGLARSWRPRRGCGGRRRRDRASPARAGP